MTALGSSACEAALKIRHANSQNRIFWGINTVVFPLLIFRSRRWLRPEVAGTFNMKAASIRNFQYESERNFCG
jgi:hypothetical protein